MPLLSPAAILGRAAFVRAKAGYGEDDEPPYSTRRLIDAAFPNVDVAGADLPRGILEMAEVHGDRRILWYSRQVEHPTQRVGLAHGLHHFMTDLRGRQGIRECNAPLRQLERSGVLAASPIEIGCDLFAGELLVPFDVLDRHAPDVLFPRDRTQHEVWTDEVDRLASTFNVPKWFMKWRLFDLMHLRRTHFLVR